MTGGNQGFGTGVAINQAVGQVYPTYGVMGFAGFAGTGYIAGRNAGVTTTWPGRPAGVLRDTGKSDYILPMKIARNNGHVNLWIDNLYIGSYAYATTATTVDLLNVWDSNALPTITEYWWDFIRITPEEVVLGGP